jgi:hypothetical protein
VIAGARFRAFHTWIDAGRAYWTTMQRFPVALRHFNAGDTAGAARSLAGAYFRAPLDHYAAQWAALLPSSLRDVAAL